jgi:hypothetical protein
MDRFVIMAVLALYIGSAAFNDKPAKSTLEQAQEYVKACPWTREDEWGWFTQSFDRDGDGAISEKDCLGTLTDRFKDILWFLDYIPFVANMDEWIASDCATLMGNCDLDGDKIIDALEFNNSEATCMNSCKSVERMAMAFDISTPAWPEKPDPVPEPPEKPQRFKFRLWEPLTRRFY